MAPVTNAGSRASSAFAPALPLTVRSPSDPPPSPMELGDLLRPRAPAPATIVKPSQATVDPQSISNNGIFALFGLLGAGMVLASIWFFFWAKNGGFRFRKGDWQEYKSTVLRRKGPNGTLLTGATPSTKLGGGSVVGSQGSRSDFPPSAPAMSEKSGGRRNPLRAAKEAAGRRREGKARKKTKPSHDPDVRAYRHEKSAKVGGFNRSPDGWFHDLSSAGTASHPAPSEAGVRAVPAQQPRTPRARQFSYQQHGSEATFSVASDDSHRPLRASPAHAGAWSGASASPAGTPRHSRQPSPTKRAPGGPAGAGQRSSRHSGRPSMPGSYVDPLDFESRYQDSVGDDSRGTKSYYHPIPGLGRSAGAAGEAAGFRRGGGGRRDSLSDSGGETGTYRSRAGT